MAQIVDIPMPADLVVQPGYTLRVTALDTSGNLVPGVNVGVVVITADPAVDSSGGGGNEPGQWFLVPGAQA